MIMKTYFEITFNRSQYNNEFNTMSEALSAVEKIINEDRAIPETIIERDRKSDRAVTIYKPTFSAKLICTEIPKYNGASLLS